MIAKMVAHAVDRAGAIEKLAGDCYGVEIWPVRTNAGFLRRALLHPQFQSGHVTTAFIGTHEAELTDNESIREALITDAAIALIVGEINPLAIVYGTASEERRPNRPGNVWREQLGFRLNAPDQSRIALTVGGQARTVTLPNDWRERFVSRETTADGIVVFDEGEALGVQTRSSGSAAGAAGDGAILSPMPGRIIAVEVAVADTVTKGQKLVTLEAMKMEHSLTAPFDGTIAELDAETGAQVSEGKMLVRVEKAA